MIKGTEKAPAIRFRGFTDDWEQRKLGDIFEEYSDKGHPNLSALTIIQGGGTIRRDDSDRNLQYDKKSLASYKKVETGDFIVHLRSFEGGLEKVTTSGIISPAYHTLHGKSTDSRFYYCYFRSERFINHDLKPYVYGIRDGRSIDIKGMKTINIPWTKVEEQKAIGNYIDCLDNLITLHQRKLELQKKLKAFFLQNMFPEEGETVPRIRFKGFTGDWEQRKLSEVTDRYDNLRVPVTANLRIPGNTPYYGANGIQDYVDGYTHDGEFILVAEDGAKELSNYPINYVNGRIWVNNHAHVLQGKNHIASNKFLAYAMRKIDIKSVLVGGGRAKLNAEAMMKLGLQLPSYSEQAKIGQYFSNLDNLITLHQRKVDQLQTVKKFMLQNLFI